MSWRAIWAAVRVLRSGQLAEGPEVKAFEEEFAAYHALPRCLAVNSGTSALELAAHLLDLKPDDEVIVPVFSCAATVVPFARRCKVVMADITANGSLMANLDSRELPKLLTPKTRAVVFVSFGGDTTGLRQAKEFCDANGLKLVHDGAQAIGSELLGLADYTAVSLQAIKTVTSVDGGFIVCADPADHERAKKLRWFGLERGVPLEGQRIAEAGYKYHMNDLTAAIGRANLRYLPQLAKHRRKLARILGVCSTRWLAGHWSNRRAELTEEAVRNGIEIGQHHYRLDRHPAFGKQGQFPFMDRQEDTYYFVPYGHHVSVRQAKRIAKLLK